MTIRSGPMSLVARTLEDALSYGSMFVVRPTGLPQNNWGVGK